MDETIFSEPLNYSKDKFPNKPSFVPNLMGRMISWSVELFEFNIKYDPRGPIKSQCLTNFVVDLGPKSVDPNNSWVLHVDGPSNTKGSGVRAVLEGLGGVLLEQSLCFATKFSNNQVVYGALIVGLSLS